MKRLVVTIATVIGTCGAAHSQMLHPGYGTLGAPQSNFLSSSYLSQQVMNDTTFKQRLGASGSARSGTNALAGIGSITFESSPAASSVAVKLARQYPAAARAEAERVFRELLAGYGQIERRFGVPSRDLAGSVAAFLAGSYMAYRNVDFPDENFKPLVAQMRGAIGSKPEIAKASNAEKQEFYEQMAIMGMFMASTQRALKQRPDPQIAANMRQAAKGYLEQFLNTDADRVQITAQGLVLR